MNHSSGSESSVTLAEVHLTPSVMLVQTLSSQCRKNHKLCIFWSQIMYKIGIPHRSQFNFYIGLNQSMLMRISTGDYALLIIYSGRLWSFIRKANKLIIGYCVPSGSYSARNYNNFKTHKICWGLRDELAGSTILFYAWKSGFHQVIKTPTYFPLQACQSFYQKNKSSFGM